MTDAAREQEPGRWRAAPEEILNVQGIELPLRRYLPDGAARRGTVLLIHGASANSDTFLIPDGGLMQHLRARGWDVWTLDWRGSSQVIDALPRPPAFLGGSLETECALFTVDNVAEFDFPAALTAIRKRLLAEAPDREPRVSVVAHCFGAGSFAAAVARNHIEGFGVRNVVLSTMGLFYEVPWNGWVKVEDFIIERTLGENPMVRAIDPRYPETWPADMEAAYEIWPRRLLPARGPAEGQKIFNRLSFMFGEPYLEELLAPGIHGPLLARLFGGMHLGLYLQAGQMVRRGHAAPLNEIDVIDRPRLKGRRAGPRAGRNDLNPRPFRDRKLTLIGGAQNQLWHRDSIDLMYEWLLTHCPGSRPTKRIFETHAHQDLLWGRQSGKVYEAIEEGL